MESLSCSHCGLRFRTPLRAAAARGPAFCCSGCAIAATLLAADPGSPGHARKSLIRLGLAAFFSANVMVLTLFLYSGDPAPAFALALVRALLLCLSAPVFLLLAPPFLRGMVRDLRRARLSMDSLISLGAGAAFAYSCASVVRGSGEVYFDTAAMILLLVTAGRLIEAYARVHSRRSLRDLLEKQAGKARVSRAGAWVEAHSREVAPGETVRVLAGERIPVDGPVLAGSASVDASAITGEPGPCAIASGDQVFAGSVCLDGMLDIECAAAGGDSLLARVASAVEQARLTPAPSERMADSLAAILTPLTLALAAVAVAVHWRHGVEGAAMTGLAVLVVACPCALGIAVPLVHVIALSAAAARGVVIRSAEALERLAAVDTVVFDKTGTLTGSGLLVARVVVFNGSTPEAVIAAAAVAAACSSHPVSRAVRRLEARPPEPAAEAREFPGRGVRVTTRDRHAILLGQPRWVAAETGEPEPSVAGEGAVALCAVDGSIAGALVLREELVPGAPEAIAECHALGLRTAVLSGDRDVAVRALAARLGIADASGGLFPEDKARRVRELRRSGRRVAVVADGINDAPALAAADVGIAVATGTDVAREVADAVLLWGGAARTPELIRAARSTRRAARFNFLCAATYNCVALSLAVAGLLRPLWAALLMLLNSAFVVLRAIRVSAHVFPPNRELSSRPADTGIDNLNI